LITSTEPVQTNSKYAVSERDPRRHNAMRHKMSAGYAGKDIQGLEATVDERVSEFIDSIDRRWISSPGTTIPVDIARRLQYFTIDTITHLCFGKPLGFIHSDSDKYNFISTIEKQLPIVQHFSVILLLNTVLRWISGIPVVRRLVVPSSADKTGIGIIMKVYIGNAFSTYPTQLVNVNANLSAITRRYPRSTEFV
jgi:hypothetical protein